VWSLRLAPSHGESSRGKYKGAVPDDTVGIVHTHPRNEASFNISAQDKKAVGIYRRAGGGHVRVNWNYMVHLNGILAVDTHGKEHVVAEQGWLSGLRVERHGIKVIGSTGR